MDQQVGKRAAVSNPISFCVAVPVGREDARLAIALRSLVAQPVDMDIALLDASNSESVRQIARGFEADLALSLHRPDTGQAAAIREGWANTSGEILCWLNTDDSLLPDSLRKVAAIFASSPETDIVYGHSVLIDHNGRAIGYHLAVEQISDAIYRTNLISQPSCFVRRRAVQDVGGIDPDLKFVMDWDLWVRLYSKGKKFHFSNEPFSNVVWEVGTKTASIAPRRLREIFELVRRKSGPWHALNTILGVLSHHVANYTSFARLKKKFQLHHPFAKHKSIGGLDRDGNIESIARIPLVNRESSPATLIAIEFEGAEDGIAELEAEGVAPIKIFRDAMRIPLLEPVQPGELRWLSISTNPGRRLRFLGAELNSEIGKPANSTVGTARQLSLPGMVESEADGPFVRLENCTVAFPATGSVKTLKQTLLRRDIRPTRDRVLLHNINLDAAAGERIGIIGRNGVGKTSLLRLIAGIYPPSRGTRTIRGKIAPVLSLGRGLDPELSLRANVSLGLIQSNRNEIHSETLVNSILEFAELSDRANDPMRRLSAGLQARFAFSLSIHQAPDILILDEIFTIGDVGFVKKAQAEIMLRLDASPILFIASHDENEIMEVCSRAILIQDGRIEMDSDPGSVFAEYRKLLAVQ